MKTDGTTLGCFHNTGIQEKSNQETGGKIYVMEDREINFIIALKSLALPTRICILEEPVVFLTHGGFKWKNCVGLSPWNVISFSLKKLVQTGFVKHLLWARYSSLYFMDLALIHASSNLRKHTLYCHFLPKETEVQKVCVNCQNLQAERGRVKMSLEAKGYN